MKKFLLIPLTFCGLTPLAQVHNAIPPEAAVFYNEARQTAKAGIIMLVENKSLYLSGKRVNGDSLIQSLSKEPELQQVNNGDLKTVALLILIKCSQNADTELKRIVLQMQKEKDEDLSFEKTAPILKRKSDLALQISKWLKQIDNQTAALKNLQ